MAEVIDGAVFYAGKFEVSVDGGADVANKQLTAVFGNKHMVSFGIGRPIFKPLINSGTGGFIEGDFPAGLGFVCFNNEMVFFNIFYSEISKFSNTNSGLE